MAEPAGKAGLQIAMVAAVAMIAHQVGGKTTRDTLFLMTFDVRKLPWIMVASALLTILVIVATSGMMRRLGPGRVVPWAFMVSAGVHLGEWAMLESGLRQLAATALFLHLAIVPVLISGFWSILSEGEDTRANRRQMTRAALAASLGGVLGGALAWYRDINLMLPLLAMLHVGCAVATLGLGRSIPAERKPPEAPPEAGGTARALFGRDILRAAPYLSYLAVGVMLFAASAALLEFVFKAHAQAELRGDELRRAFSVFYTSIALLALLVQLSLSKWALKKVGLAPTAATLPFVVTVGSAFALVMPGLMSAAIARGSEVVVRNSLFRSAYEPLYTAVPAKARHASKSIVDVAFERVGDALGAGIALALIPLGVGAASAQLVFAMALSIGGLWLARLIHLGYQKSLRENIRGGLVHVDPSQLVDSTTIRISRDSMPAIMSAGRPAPPPAASLEHQIAGLRSNDPERIRRVLAGGATIEHALVPHIIPLLGRDEVAGRALEALRRVAASNIGQLVDCLLDTSVDLAVRRRIPRTLEVCDSARAVEGLMSGLQDARFEIRLQCGRALANMRDRRPEFRVDDERTRPLVLHEVEVERGVWEARHVLEGPDDHGVTPMIDERLRQRANRSLEHVFNLLSLSLAREPLKLAFRALNTDDRYLRGTALDYLETVLPRAIRDKLWRFLEPERPSGAGPGTREAALEALMHSHQSIEMSLATIHGRLQTPGEPKT